LDTNKAVVCAVREPHIRVISIGFSPQLRNPNNRLETRFMRLWRESMRMMWWYMMGLLCMCLSCVALPSLEGLPCEKTDDCGSGLTCYK
jgi:hypothetical protein